MVLVGETRTLSEAAAAGRRLQGADASELKGLVPDGLILGTKTEEDPTGLDELYFEPMRRPSVRRFERPFAGKGYETPRPHTGLAAAFRRLPPLAPPLSSCGRAHRAS